MPEIVIDIDRPEGAGQITEALIGRVKQFMHAATMECTKQLAVSTPVDTGRARYGWFCSVNNPSDETPPKGKYSFPDIHTRTNVGEFSIQDTLYITNNVPYIRRLNNGWSKQAPARFVEMAADRVQNAINTALKKSLS